MLNPARVDAAVDLAYGALILVAIALIATVEFGIGIAFAVGVFSAYVLHVVWKMARFDPDWMTSVVEDAVDDAVGDSVEKAVEDSMEQAVEHSVEQAVDDSMEQVVDDSMEQVVDDSMEQAVEHSVEEVVDNSVASVVDERVAARVDETLGDQLDSVQAQVEAVDDRLDSTGPADRQTESDDEAGDSRASRD